MEMSSNTIHPGRGTTDAANEVAAMLQSLAAVPEAVNQQEETLAEMEEVVDDHAHVMYCLTANLREAEETIESQQERINALEAQVEELQTTVEEQQKSVDAVRSVFSDRVLNKEDAHQEALDRESDEVVELGESRTVVVDDTNYDHPSDKKAVAHIDGLVVLVDAPDESLDVGDKQQVRISDVRDNCAHAVQLTG